MSERHPVDPASVPVLKRETVVQAEPTPDARRILVFGVPMFLFACALVPLVAMLFRSHTQMTLLCIDQDTPAARARALPVSDALLAGDTAIGAEFPVGPRSSVARSWQGVAASPGPYGVLAVWSETELFVSADDGRRFRQVLGGPGDIGAATIDDAGVVFMTRDYQRLGVYVAPDRETWRALPFAGDTLALAADYGWLAWLGLAHDGARDAQLVLALSRDHGATWRTQTIASHADRALMRIEADGFVHMLLLVEDNAAPTMSRLRGHVDGRALEQLARPSDYADAWGLGHGGWAYAIASECADDDNDICAMSSESDARLLSTHTLTDWQLIMASNGASTLAASGDTLLRFEHERVHALTERIPTEISALSVDGIDRALAVVGQDLLRWSPGHGWRVLLSRDDAERLF